MASKIIFITLVLAFASFGHSNGERITRSQVGRCICSDFTYFNRQRILVGDCRVGLNGGIFNTFCYVHRPNSCDDSTRSQSIRGMSISVKACQNRNGPINFFSLDRNPQSNNQQQSTQNINLDQEYEVVEQPQYSSGQEQVYQAVDQPQYSSDQDQVYQLVQQQNEPQYSTSQDFSEPQQYTVMNQAAGNNNDNYM